jgi:hypothetical protein
VLLLLLCCISRRFTVRFCCVTFVRLLCFWKICSSMLLYLMKSGVKIVDRRDVICGSGTHGTLNEVLTAPGL